ncbi:hypothetical protein KALB_5449 [Kutzneria albida DSM 43870]|uniref:UspA domain-containing protein n=1 Tax=Kutzneria albida DSM 43870 TaxID=1449976 RepID=W5WE11_9PSEU|nr:hypothetical protein KALB_5449 [Kutzneria albida DSM 43870]
MLPVVVGVDGSTTALYAVRWAAGEAARRQVPLRLVYAQTPPDDPCGHTTSAHEPPGDRAWG